MPPTVPPSPDTVAPAAAELVTIRGTVSEQNRAANEAEHGAAALEPTLQSGPEMKPRTAQRTTL